MNHLSQHYSQAELRERRDAQSTQVFRKRLGVLAVMTAIAIPVAAAGGARPAAHDVIDFVNHRAEMIGDAFSSHPDMTGQVPSRGPNDHDPSSKV